MNDHIESQIMAEYVEEYNNLAIVAESILKRIKQKKDEDKINKIYIELNKYIQK